MRYAVAGILALLAALAIGQGDTDKKRSLFLTVKPQITVLVQEHPTGAEDVKIGVVMDGYPPELLKEQVERLGALLGGGARWSYLEMRAGTLQASFAVNGLIDRQKGLYRLQPIARAFAGAPAPNTVDSIAVVFAAERGYPNDIATYQDPGLVEVEAMRNYNPDMLEYRIHLLSQDPEKLVIPEKHAGKSATTVAVKGEPSRVLFYVLLVVAGLAAGVLVYLALLRFVPRAGS